jgi:DNA-binding FadR family transcriptional regulator
VTQQSTSQARPARARGERTRAGVASPLSLRGLHGQLVESIGKSIAACEFAAGQQISPELLAENFGVSRSVVREVLKVLEAKGMIGARPRTGTRVRPQTWWNMLDPDVIRWRSTGPDSARQFEELLGIRGAVEPLAARNATAAATPTDIRDLTESLDAMSDAVTTQDRLAFTEADVEFHRALLRASGSLIVAQLADPIEASLRAHHKMRVVPVVLSREVILTHGAILDAILRHDGARAELASRQIVDVAGAEIMESLMRENARSESEATTGEKSGEREVHVREVAS